MIEIKRSYKITILASTKCIANTYPETQKGMFYKKHNYHENRESLMVVNLTSQQLQDTFIPPACWLRYAIRSVQKRNRIIQPSGLVYHLLRLSLFQASLIFLLLDFRPNIN